jgi:alpha-N-acetylglucosamine transferase
VQAYVTVLTGDGYAPGAVALARSLRAVGATRPLVVLATSAVRAVAELEGLGCEVRRIALPPLSEDFQRRHATAAIHAASPFTRGTKPAFHDTLHNFAKLRLWELGEYRKVVYLDADTLVIRNIDELFEYPPFAAAPNLYERVADLTRMNSGVFVAQPSPLVFADMLRVLESAGRTYRRTDQTFLEEYFPAWHRLPYIYNTLQYVYFNLPELWRWREIRVIHHQYEKPWDPANARREQLRDVIELWQTIHDTGRLPAELPPDPTP